MHNLLFIGRHASSVVVATSYVAVHFGETGKIPKPKKAIMWAQCLQGHNLLANAFHAFPSLHIYSFFAKVKNAN